MLNVFAQPSRLRRCAHQFPVLSAAILSSAAILPGTAWASCTQTGTTVTCDGSSASFVNTGPTGNNVNVTVDGTAVVVAPLQVGDNSTLTVASGGNVQGSTAIPSVQLGINATVVNNGTITSGIGTSPAGGISVGTNSTVTNNGTLTAVAGTPAVEFVASGTTSTNGSFTNGATAPTAVTGDINFGYNSGTNGTTTNVGTFTNVFNSTTTATSTATYGLTGNVIGHGNLAIDNEGQWTGSLEQTAFDPAGVGSTVTFTNGNEANFAGVISTGDSTTVINNAIGKNLAGVGYAMLLGTSTIGGSGSSTSSLTNNGVLTIGSTAAPALVQVFGSFTQNAAGTLNMAITGSTPNTSGVVDYSEIEAIGGTAKLGGILNVNVVAGIYPVGSKFDLIVADQGITGNFATNGVVVTNASGAVLPFITFNPSGTASQNGVVNTPTATDPNQQSYELTVTRVGTYATDIQAAGAGTPNQLAVATALNPIVAVAEAAGNTTTNETTLIGQIDQLTIPQATALFDELSPAGLVSYANALRDEANTLERQIQLRLGDQNSDHAEDGWWGGFNGQADLSKGTVDTSKQTLFGFNGGFDLSGPHHVFGLAGSVMFDSLNNAGSTLTGHNRDFAFGGYAGYDAGPIHLTGLVQYNFGHLSTSRNLTLGTTTATGTGSASEGLFKATATAGIMLKAGGYTLEPFGGIDFDHGHIHGFTEQGDGAAALTVLPISANRTDVLAGVSLTRSTGKFRPYVRATFRDEIGNHPADSLVSAYFDGNTATQFTVTGVPAAKREGDLNAGVNWVFEDAGSLFIGYQGTIRSGYNVHGINLGIRLEF